MGTNLVPVHQLFSYLADSSNTTQSYFGNMQFTDCDVNEPFINFVDSFEQGGRIARAQTSAYIVDEWSIENGAWVFRATNSLSSSVQVSTECGSCGGAGGAAQHQYVAQWRLILTERFALDLYTSAIGGTLSLYGPAGPAMFSASGGSLLPEPFEYQAVLEPGQYVLAMAHQPLPVSAAVPDNSSSPPILSKAVSVEADRTLLLVLTPFPACSNGIDDDGDGMIDAPSDPGCETASSSKENPRCDDDLDNDGDGKADWDGGHPGGTPDPQCVARPWKDTEASPVCGLGAELVLAIPLMALARSRRRLARS